MPRSGLGASAASALLPVFQNIQNRRSDQELEIVT